MAGDVSLEFLTTPAAAAGDVSKDAEFWGVMRSGSGAEGDRPLLPVVMIGFQLLRLLVLLLLLLVLLLLALGLALLLVLLGD